MRSRKIVVVVLVLLVLVGCGTTQSAKVSILQVVRPAGKYSSFAKTVNNAASVQHLYNLAYALPPRPSGKINCPADNGTVYNMKFLEGTTSVQTMVLQASGCQFLYITGIQDARIANQSFQDTFLKINGLSSLIPYHTPGP